ncbi:glycosyltransferase [Verticiella sediminum]|uniref:Glycosyltransferase n=1 Tax=Verticiella sediminum TaxID=1247510 RepID=A0A556A7I1_9BURK|nr:glycosyltransferase [Verticiella sediminum]TSH88842.1 glycosyltransferase [Verticiella sediminum]
MTAPAAAKLSRPVLLGVCLVYILFGLFGRDPWKTDDVIGMAQMWSAVHLQGEAWLLPQVAGITATANGPLAMWAGAGAMWLLGPWIGEINAARLPNLLWFAITTSSVWYGTYLLGRRSEAQPLALPFGGQPAPSDYGRMLADAALLLLIATLGLTWRTHETSVIPAAVACQALAFYSVARMLDRPWLGAATLGLALAGAVLTRGGATLLPLLAALPFALPATGWRGVRAALLLAAPLAVLLVAAWWMPALDTSLYWMQGWYNWHTSFFGLPTLDGTASALRNAPWFLWPLWPLALLALVRWRGWYGAAHLRVPLAFGGGALLMLLVTHHPGEAELLGMVVPTAMLSALALPTLRRGQVNWLDWFAVMAFSVAAFLVWFGWTTALSGWPNQIANNIERQTPGFQMQFVWLAVLGALLATAAWVALITWRLRVHPAALWRGSMLSAGGVLVTWVLLNLLWLAPIDYARSYRPVANAIAQTLAEQGPGECVRTRGLNLAQRASFAVLGGLVFSFDGACRLVVQQTDQDELPELRADETLLWEGARPADRQEWYRVIRVSP